jgi:hypothetical protein
MPHHNGVAPKINIYPHWNKPSVHVPTGIGVANLDLYMLLPGNAQVTNGCICVALCPSNAQKRNTFLSVGIVTSNANMDI